MIDLRSDTFTIPTEGMRKAIFEAPVGDDVFGEDPSVNELQEYAAHITGKEAALYVPSGVMGNQISLAVLTTTGEEAIIESDAHIFFYEAASPSVISRIQLRCIPSERGMMPIEEIKKAVRPEDAHFPQTSLICIENTHNRHGGSIIPLDYIKEVEQIVIENGLKYHCDGARLWHASTAAGISLNEYCEPFDTVSLCLSKGLGAPVGSVIVGSKDNIKKAHKWRKMLGGGMRQAGIIAAAGLYAIKNHFHLLPETHNNTRYFANLIHESEFIELDPETVETNIIVFRHTDNIDSNELVEECKNQGLLILSIGNNMIRAVFHFQISEKQTKEAAEIIKDVTADIAK